MSSGRTKKAPDAEIELGEKAHLLQKKWGKVNAAKKSRGGIISTSKITRTTTTASTKKEGTADENENTTSNNSDGSEQGELRARACVCVLLCAC